MRFYTQAHRHHCDIDLPARSMYVCIMDQSGKVLAHENINALPQPCWHSLLPAKTIS
jgi:hypothetical protein